MSRTTLLLLLVACFSPSLSAQDPFGGDPFGGTAGDSTSDPFGMEPGSSDPFASDTGESSPFGPFATPMPNPASAPAGAAAGFADSAGAGGRTDEVAGQDQVEDNPIVRLLRQRSPQSPSEVADGLTWLSRIQRWDEVGRLLDAVAARKWSLDEKAELARHAGNALWIRLLR